MKILTIFFFLFSYQYLFSNTNPDFDSTLNGWTATGNCFEHQPVHGDKIPTSRIRPAMSDSIGGDYWREIPHSIGHHGEYWLSSGGSHASDTNFSEGDLLTGTLTSDEFTIQNSKIYLLIGGTGGRAELLIKNRNDFDVVESVSPDGIEILSRKYFDTKDHINESAVIRIIDDRTDAHINADDFILDNSFNADSDKLISYDFRTSFDPSVQSFHKLGYFKFRDTNLPMWGFADTHAHWMNNIGFGGELVFGRPDGKIDTALKDCSEIHGVEGLGNFLYGKKNITTSFFLDGDKIIGHNTMGYPDFTGWPNFRNLMHQVMYVDWVKRAYMGGLRVMVCQLSNNESFAALFGSEYSNIDDNNVVDMELKYLIKMIRKFRKEKWIEIAKSSEDIKRINLENKLAVVIGVEVDRPGNFVGFDDRDSAANLKRINSYIESIYDKGIRYIYPIHEIDNVFGGFALYASEIFSLGNYNAKKDYDDMDEKDKYVQVEGNSRFSFRLGDENDFQFNASKSLTGYNPPYDYKKMYKGLGHINKLGLTDYGKYFIHKLIEKGIIIDIDHMSFKSATDFFNIAKKYNYPAMAGHTNFLDLQFTRLETDHCANCFMNIRHEHSLTEEMLHYMNLNGGMVSPTTSGDKNVKTFLSPNNSVLNDNPGSSKTFAQSYLYALEKMHNKGVGLGTDMNGFLTQICPRFGSFSSYSLREDDIGKEGAGSRRKLILMQTSGVSYNKELQDCRHHKFFSDFPALNEEDSRILQAIYSSHSSVKLMLTECQQMMINGFQIALMNRVITRRNARSYGLNEVELAAYLIALEFEKNDTINLAKIGWFKDLNQLKVEDYIKKIYPMYKSFMNTRGNNIPLKRYMISISRNNVVDYDFNIDGLAHYGLFPDFFQDLKNIGLTPEQLTPLFNSAKDFMNMMGKCETISK